MYFGVFRCFKCISVYFGVYTDRQQTVFSFRRVSGALWDIFSTFRDFARVVSRDSRDFARVVSRDSREASPSLARLSRGFARVSRGYDQCTKNKEYLGKKSQIFSNLSHLYPVEKNIHPKYLIPVRLSYTRKILVLRP